MKISALNNLVKLSNEEQYFFSLATDLFCTNDAHFYVSSYRKKDNLQFLGAKFYKTLQLTTSVRIRQAWYGIAVSWL